MCLRLNEKGPLKKEFIRDNQLEPDDVVVVYKVLRRSGASPFRYFRWKKGENISDRSLAELSTKEVRLGYVNHGFHAYTGLEKARAFAGPSKVIRTVHVKVKNIVAFGRHGDIVFTRGRMF